MASKSHKQSNFFCIESSSGTWLCLYCKYYTHEPRRLTPGPSSTHSQAPRDSLSVPFSRYERRERSRRREPGKRQCMERAITMLLCALSLSHSLCLCYWPLPCSTSSPSRCSLSLSTKYLYTNLCSPELFCCHGHCSVLVNIQFKLAQKYIDFRELGEVNQQYLSHEAVQNDCWNIFLFEEDIVLAN